MTRSPATLGFVVIGFAWGASFLFIGVLIDAGLEPFGVGAARSLLGAAALLPIAWLRRHRLPRRASTWAALAALGALNIAVPWTLIPLGQERIASGVASVANSTAPLWAAAWTLGLASSDRATGARMAGLVAGLAGVAVLSLDDLSGLSGDDLIGTTLVVAATGCYGLSAVIIRRAFAGVEPIALGVAQIGAAALILLPLALLTGAFEGARMGVLEWSSLALLGLVNSGVIFVMYMDLIARVGAVRATVVTYLMPPVGVTLGWAILGEPVGWNLLASLVLVLAGVALTQAGAGPLRALVRRNAARLGRLLRPNPRLRSGRR